MAATPTPDGDTALDVGTRREWRRFFAAHGFAVAREAASPRLSRDWRQPYARTCFVLDRLAGPVQTLPPRRSAIAT